MTGEMAVETKAMAVVKDVLNTFEGRTKRRT